MATGILGQANPGATTLTDTYTVPAGVTATARVIVANRSTATTYRISVAPGGAGDSLEQYVVYNQSLAANDAVSSATFTLAATDVVRVYSQSGSVSFTVTGYET